MLYNESTCNDPSCSLHHPENVVNNTTDKVNYRINLTDFEELSQKYNEANNLIVSLHQENDTLRNRNSKLSKRVKLLERTLRSFNKLTLNNNE